MKKHLFRTMVLFCGLALLSSCMKNDPANNETVYYGYQQIPNINEFMPYSLLEAMGEDNLYYGDEPPKIEGAFLADNAWRTNFIKAPNSPCVYSSDPTPMGDQYFMFSDQHKGIAKLSFLNPHLSDNPLENYIERSDTDTTYLTVTANPELFINDTIAPSYFQNGNYQKENFNTIYIMGEAPNFTAYYYEIRDTNRKGQPLNAVIISGCMDKETIIVNDTVNHKTDTIVQPIIKNLRWGVETMMYYNEAMVSQIISLGYLPSKGDIMLIEKRGGDTHIGEFHE